MDKIKTDISASSFSLTKKITLGFFLLVFLMSGSLAALSLAFAGFGGPLDNGIVLNQTRSIMAAMPYFLVFIASTAFSVFCLKKFKMIGKVAQALSILNVIVLLLFFIGLISIVHLN